jgi:PPIC-type PPIASE domain
MRVNLVLFFCLLVINAGMLLAQAAPSAPTASSPSSSAEQKKPAEGKPPSTSAESSVGADDTVITLRGVCATPGPVAPEKDDSCKTVVSRREFELLANSINLDGKPISMAARQNLAKAYAEYLVYEEPAKKAGVEDSAQYREIMRWLGLRMLTDVYREQINEQYRTPSDAEVARYYQENVADFDRVHVVRIMVPRNLRLPGEETAQVDKDARNKKLLAVANEAHQRAVKGEDPEQIQKDAYSGLGLGAAPPPTDLGKQGRKDFIAEESAELFSLKVGDVTKVESEDASYVIYKVIGRETLPESEVKAQISREIARGNIEKANQAITQSVQPEYNEKYFGPPAADVPARGKPAHP